MYKKILGIVVLFIVVSLTYYFFGINNYHLMRESKVKPVDFDTIKQNDIFDLNSGNGIKLTDTNFQIKAEADGSCRHAADICFEGSNYFASNDNGKTWKEFNFYGKDNVWFRSKSADVFGRTVYRLDGDSESLFGGKFVIPDPLSKIRPIKIVTGYKLNPKSDGLIDEPINYEFTIVGTEPPYTWKVIKDNLPDGVTFKIDDSFKPDNDKASLKGTPSETGLFDISLAVKDNLGNEFSAYYPITIGREPQAYAMLGEEFKKYRDQRVAFRDGNITIGDLDIGGDYYLEGDNGVDPAISNDFIEYFKIKVGQKIQVNNYIVEYIKDEKDYKLMKITKNIVSK